MAGATGSCQRRVQDLVSPLAQALPGPQRGRAREEGGVRAAVRAVGEGDEADRHPPGGPQLSPPAGAAAGDHAQHAGEPAAWLLSIPGCPQSLPLCCIPGCCWHTAPYPVPYLVLPQLEVDLLKAENDRLKVAPGPSAVPGSVPSHVTSTSASSSPRRSLGLTLGQAFSPGLGDAGKGDRAAGRWGRAGIEGGLCGGKVLLLSWSEQGICCAAGAAVSHSRICIRLGTGGLVARLSLPAQPHCSIPRCVPHGCCQRWHPEG